MTGQEPAHIPKGFTAAGVPAGIKASGRPDLGLIFCEHGAAAAAVMTTNRFQAAPIQLCRRRLAGAEHHLFRGLIVNSGNANAMTGDEGLRDAEQMAAAAEHVTDSPPGSFLVASTGIIGKRLPVERIDPEGARAARTALSADGWVDFSRAIMTTDLTHKISSRPVRLSDGSLAAVLGMAKGSGMIRPNMATMLGFVVTDVPVALNRARALLLEATEHTFNCLTVDGQTSTNDMVLLLSSRPLIPGKDPAPPAADEAAFLAALTDVCRDLAKMIAIDGEGATKLVTVKVAGAEDFRAARTLAMEVANSALVKTAVHGENPNWGRIAQSLGQASAGFDPEAVSIRIQGEEVLRGGLPRPFELARLNERMKDHDVLIEASVGAGPGEAEVWTCDFSAGYVKINAEYN